MADWGVPMTEAKIVAYIIANLAPFYQSKHVA